MGSTTWTSGYGRVLLDDRGEGGAARPTREGAQGRDVAVGVHGPREDGHVHGAGGEQEADAGALPGGAPRVRLLRGELLRPGPERAELHGGRLVPVTAADSSRGRGPGSSSHARPALPAIRPRRPYAGGRPPRLF